MKFSICCPALISNRFRARFELMPLIKLLLDIDGEAGRVAEHNARTLGMRERARFARADLWSASTLEVLEEEKPDLLVCNPPYVPEPPGTRMQLEAGAGPHGTAHLLRTLELTRVIQPPALALSWCSLSDPAGIVAAATDCGYGLHALYIAAIADGEYSGSVHSYLRGLDNCFINEQRDTQSARFPSLQNRAVIIKINHLFRL